MSSQAGEIRIFGNTEEFKPGIFTWKATLSLGGVPLLVFSSKNSFDDREECLKDQKENGKALLEHYRKVLSSTGVKTTEVIDNSAKESKDEL